MTMQAVAFAQYAQSAAATASPHEVVRMAYERIMTACDRAEQAGRSKHAGWLQVFHDETTTAQAILLELTAGLALGHSEPEVVALAASLESLYGYAMQQLVQANTQKIVEPLYAVHLVVGGLHDAWVTGQR